MVGGGGVEKREKTRFFFFLFFKMYAILRNTKNPSHFEHKRNERIAGSLLWHNYQPQSTTCYLCAKNMIMINGKEEGKNK